MLNRSSRVYVAGHRGLIGSACVRRLRDRGFERIIVADHSRLDLTDPHAVNAFFELEKPEYVILAAGKVGGIVENKTFPADFITTNLAIQLNVLTAARKTNVKRLIFFGSSCMYPRECPQPMNEDMLLSGTPEPTSLAYAISKIAGVQMCLASNQQDGQTRFIPVIPNSAFGPHDNFDPTSGHVLSALVRKFHDAKVSGSNSVTLWGSGSPMREFVYSNDIADGCIALLENDISQLKLPVNIGTGTELSIRALATKLAETVGYTRDIVWDRTKPDGAPRKLLDSSRMRSFGWSPRVDFELALKSTYRWYVENEIRTTDARS